VATYRIYRVGAEGGLQRGPAFDAEHDGAAVEAARALRRSDEQVELWQGGRRVGRFSKLGVFTPERA
jgi:hypothetical protein